MIWFSKNELNFELAYRITYEEIHSRALFPHIFIKNISFQVNFGQLNTVGNRFLLLSNKFFLFVRNFLFDQDFVLSMIIMKTIESEEH